MNTKMKLLTITLISLFSCVLAGCGNSSPKQQAMQNTQKEYPLAQIFKEAYDKGEGSILPDRRKLDGTRTPWNMEGVFIGGKTYLSFPAVRYNEEEIFREMEERAGSVPSPMIGLNNIGDLAFAHKHPEYSYFADIYLYLPNREAAALLKECVPSLVGGYLWVERDSYERPWPFTPTSASGYRMPLFISRSCYRHDSLGLSCDECKRHSLHHIRQNERRYIVSVYDCMTIVR